VGRTGGRGLVEGFVHPVTGELLEADQVTLAAAQAETEATIGRLYRALDPIRERLGELRGPAVLPRPSRRTDKQRDVSRCPSCGKRLDV
jgi:hypothetical protein